MTSEDKEKLEDIYELKQVYLVYINKLKKDYKEAQEAYQFLCDMEWEILNGFNKN